MKAPTSSNVNSGVGGYRTYSFIHHVGGAVYNNSNWLTHEGLYKKHAQIRHPSEKFVMVEENDNRCMNQGSWVMGLAQGTLVDPFAVFHNMRSDLGFADGHIESIGWKDKRTEEHSQAITDGTGSFAAGPFNPINEDINWLIQHYAKQK